MLAKLNATAAPVFWGIDRIGKRFPLFTMYLLQVVTGLMLIGAVGLVAFMGGSVIWLIYSLLGVI